jgi:hypothetical protein
MVPLLKPSLSLDEPLDFIGTEAKTLSGQFHFLQLTAPAHGVHGLNFKTQHDGDFFGFEQAILRLSVHSMLLYMSIYYCRVN